MVFTRWAHLWSFHRKTHQTKKGNSAVFHEGNLICAWKTAHFPVLICHFLSTCGQMWLVVTRSRFSVHVFLLLFAEPNSFREEKLRGRRDAEANRRSPETGILFWGKQGGKRGFSAGNWRNKERKSVSTGRGSSTAVEEQVGWKWARAGGRLGGEGGGARIAFLLHQFRVTRFEDAGSDTLIGFALTSPLPTHTHTPEHTHSPHTHP